ncbi:O-methyltransferase [Mangrovimonas xylaniphaga]|uniref:O-methyltransferase n=1 Tax=Mangrovimonas xylaniphaga TaxID=1645915 RepID=UPI002934637D|nr:class I SAM-dependent methyltransferase [Mangrovimonas xylaniphaga]
MNFQKNWKEKLNKNPTFFIVRLESYFCHNMYQLLQYFKFLWRSTNQHGVHSPFVYQLVTLCFYDRKKYESYPLLKQYRKALYRNHSPISITDLGAGSRIFKNNTRKVSKIAKTSGITSKRAKLLNRLVGHLEATHILELGTSLGMGTTAMAIGHQESQITTIEGCPNTTAVAQKQFQQFQLNNINSIIADFTPAIQQLDNQTYDLIYMDGNHQKTATLYYFSELLDTVHNDTIIILDDIHWSKDMTEAWEEIKAHPKVTVTIDTFYWGMVFFRTEQRKEHFSIRV